jgi:hypothetical protein
MSYERYFGGFAGHNVDRRLWVRGLPVPRVLFLSGYQM